MLAELSTEKKIYTVSMLNREVRLLLDGSFPPLWIEGEISNLRQPGSGHLYFSLKDELSQIRCAMFRMRTNLLNFQPKDGMHVLMRVKISLYEERGDFQLVVEHMEEAGEGALRRAFEALKKRLSEEGLFDNAHKKPLPSLPYCIGVVTSPTGAAIRDIISVLKRRFPAIPIIIYPTQVQGSEAADQIVRALKLANQHQACDVIIVARGGGSLEDLWPFNEEKVARAIHASIIPIVSAIGHEIDFTIADFVADQRAATPSAAAELISPDCFEWLQTIDQLRARMKHFAQAHLRHLQLELAHLKKRLQHPGQRLEHYAQRLDDLEQRLRLTQNHWLKHLLAELNHLSIKLMQYTPIHRIQKNSADIVFLQQRLKAGMQYQLSQAKQNITHLMRSLNNVNPLNTLNRGYAIIRKNDKILCNANDLAAGDEVTAQLAQARLQCRVETILQASLPENSSLSLESE